MTFNELKQHGTENFPFEFYKVDASHSKYEMAFHWHSSVEILRISSGSLYVTLDNRSFTAKAGDIVFVNSEVIHGATSKDCVYECFVFDPEFLKTNNEECDLFLDGLLSRNYFVAEKLRGENIEKIVDALFTAMDERKNGFLFKVIGLTQVLIGEIREKILFYSGLAATTERDAQKIRKLKKVLKYIRDNFASEMSLDDMAREAELSTKYFCAFFKAMTGTTPGKYLLTYRLEQAAKKLVDSDSSITDIAHDCGFNDLSYFIKMFKEFKGITPRIYRKR